ncbi:hypothetical protein [Streptomyces sp. NBC_00353]|uniref:hypothetical protein n=1 Tax=Streptomyces sp. NBC_00353 TaxID=2975722 RepID=UPI003FA7952F
MPTAAPRDASPYPDPGALSFLAAAAALEAIDAAVRGARARDGTPPSSLAGREQVLASLLLLREVREQLARADHRDLAGRIDSITHHTGQLRRNATVRRQEA